MMLIPFTGVPHDDGGLVIDEDEERDNKNRKDGRKGNVKMLIQTNSSMSKGLDDPLLNRDIWLLTKKYFKRDAYIDILANFPILFYTIFVGFPMSIEDTYEYNDYYLFWVCMSLKTLRIFHIDEVIDVMTRIIDKLGDIFYLHRYFFENLLAWSLAAFKFLFCVHYFSCAWIMIMKMKMIRG